jgi:hypothetical protein
MNTTYHPLSCRCGALQGRLALKVAAIRVVCYCKDCQAFARFLEREDDVLDAHGGSEIVQTTPDGVAFTQGQAHLKVMKLSDKGMLRWYAACCRTPVGNTMNSRNLPFVGLLHSCLDTAPLEPSFGPVRARFNAASASGEPRPVDQNVPGSVLQVAARLVLARMSGRHRRTPFFTDAGLPVVAPKVVTAQERERLRRGPDGAAPV